MRCLYCGKELALLKRWSRRGQFCSEAHRKTYQEEYNRIGLSRLLQAQSKTVPVAASQETAPPSNGSSALHEALVAVEETPFEEAPASEAIAQDPAHAHEDGPEEAVWEPEQVAGFIKGPPAAPLSVEIPVYAESWNRAINSPLPPELRSRGQVEQALPQASKVELNCRPGLSGGEHPATEVKVTANQFVPGKTLPPAAEVSLANRFASAGLVRQIVEPWASEWGAAANVDSALAWPFQTEYWQSALLRLPLSQIPFSEEAADVMLALEEPIADSRPPADEAILWPDLEQMQPESYEADQAESPSAVVPSLAKLHDGLNHVDEPAPVPEMLASEVLAPEAPGPDVPAPQAIQPDAILPEPAAPTEAHSNREQAPRLSPRMVEIPIKTFAPSKPAPKEGADALIEMPVFLPRLTGLPLRPKMGLAMSSTAPATKKTGRQGAPSIQSTPEPKSVSDSKVAAEPKSTSDTGASGKLAQPGASRTSTPPAAKIATPPARPVENTIAGKTEPAAPEKGRPEDKQSGRLSGSSDPAEKRAVAPERKQPQPAPSEPEVRQIEAPIFGGTKTATESLLSSFMMKVVIAALVVAFCGTVYFVFGGKSQPPATAAALDKAGPSIMVGSGGWVEGWAGDPADTHYGRQITIYRPSLKLSDYRIEFKGEIETKSLGWVFRATDPEDYYAMKLAIVTPGLKPKVALLKYMVAHGRETQVGRVPIDLDVQLDTVYSVRVDVKGPKFITYVQGQLMDTWIDDHLTSGGVGFLNEREERGRVKSVTVSLLTGGK
jgi:hypothetical protein